MTVEVIQPYYDVKAEGVLREKGALLHYEDEQRAKELIQKGVVRERKVIRVLAEKAEEDKETDKSKKK